MKNEYEQSLKMMLSQKYGNLKDSEWNLVMNEVSDRDILESLSKLYSETYSEKKIDEMINFFKSSTGKKFIQNQSEMIEKFQNNRMQLFNITELKAKELSKN